MSLTSIVSGGLINFIILTKNGALIFTNSMYTITGPVVDRLTATSQYILSDSNNNQLGTF